jgi:hypothetical protein
MLQNPICRYSLLLLGWFTEGSDIADRMPRNCCRSCLDSADVTRCFPRPPHWSRHPTAYGTLWLSGKAHRVAQP